MKPILFALAAIACLITPASADEKKAAPAQKAAALTSKDVSPDEAEKIIREKKEVVVLDVRTADEFKSGHIAGAKNVDFHSDDFAKKVGELDKSKDYLVHCAAGGRSSQTLEAMKKHGFAGTVYHLKSGFSGWQKAGKPVEK